VCTPTWYSMYLMIKELSKANVPVVLTGHGGDELLGGYWDHYHYRFQDIRSSGADDAAEQAAWLSNHGRDPLEYTREREYVDALKNNGGLHVARFSKYLASVQEDVRRAAGQPSHASVFGTALDRRLSLELLYETVPASLRAEDRNCMAFSIENRVPFL